MTLAFVDELLTGIDYTLKRNSTAFRHVGPSVQ